MPIQINFILNQTLDFKTYDGQKTIMPLDASRKLMGLKKKKKTTHLFWPFLLLFFCMLIHPIRVPSLFTVHI